MKKVTFVLGALFLSLSGQAQTYKLTDVTAEEFAAGGTAQWSFEQYTVTTGQFSKLAQYGDSSMANFLDIYNPERLQTKRITEIDGVEANGTKTYASNIRKAWYNVANNGNTGAANLVYVAQDQRDGFGYEIYGTNTYSSVVTFTAPSDGFYTVKGSVIREDHPAQDGLSLRPVYRYATQTDDIQRGGMGIEFAYGFTGGEKPDYDGQGHISKGASQRYIPEVPSNFSMSFKAKQGDRVSFQVAGSGLVSSDRGCWARTFLPQLDITLSDEATAKADTNFVDPYDTKNVDNLLAYMDSLEALSIEMSDKIGVEFGQYEKAPYDAFNKMLSEIQTLIDKGIVNGMNAEYYKLQLKNAWNMFLQGKIVIDYKAENNYRLIYSTGSLADGTISTTVDTEAMSNNDDNPWGYYRYNNNDGTYTKYPNHNSSNKGGSNGWYNGGGDWAFLLDNGFLHPSNGNLPAYVFTAPADGIYKVYARAYRNNPNQKVENPLYLTSRYYAKDGGNVDNATYIVRTEYGSVANDGQKGKAPVNNEFFINLKAGDRVTVELGMATDKNSSAGTQMLDLNIISRVNSDSVYTAEIAQNSGLLYFNPYLVGDATVLKATIAKADSILAAQKDNIGIGDGQYSSNKYDVLEAVNEMAKELVAKEGTAEATQIVIDVQTKDLEKAIADFITSRNGFHLTLSGDWSIRIAGTQNRLTQKNKASDHYYAAFTDYAGVESDAKKNGFEPTEYNWTFTFTPSEEDENKMNITGKEGYLTQDGYVLSNAYEAPAENTLELLTAEKGDSIFAIRRVDGKYWSNGFNWNSPYDKVKTSENPQYIFVVDTVTLATATSINAISENNKSAKVIATSYYTVDGRKVTSPVQGLNVVKQTLTDGHTIAKKIFVK